MRSAEQEAKDDMARLVCDLVDLGHFRLAMVFLEAILMMGDGDVLAWRVAESAVDVRAWMASL